MPLFSGTSQILEFMKGKFLALHNYEEWSIRMKWVLVSEDLWDVIQETHNLYDPHDLAREHQAFKYIMLTIDDTVCSRVLQRSFIISKHLWDYLESEFGKDNQHKKKQQKSQIEQSYFEKSEAETQVTGEVIELANEAVEECLPLWCQMQLGGQQLDVIESGQQDSIRNNALKKLKGTKKSPIFNLSVPEIHDDHSVLFGNLWDEVGNMRSQTTEQSSTRSVHLLEEIDRSNLSDLHLQHEVVDCRFVHDADDSMKQVHETFHLLHGMADPERSINQCAEDYLGLEILHLLHEDLGEEQTVENLQGVMTAKEEFVSEFPWIDVDAELSDSSSVFTMVSKSDMQLPYAICVDFHRRFACPHATPEEDNSPICMGFYSYEDDAGFMLQVYIGAWKQEQQTMIYLMTMEARYAIAATNIDWMKLIYSNGSSKYFNRL